MTARHEMVRTATTDTGADEWTCTSCTRRLLLRVPPDYGRLVLDRGDETAAHSGGTAGVRVTADVTPPVAEDADRAWLGEHGITWNP